MQTVRVQLRELVGFDAGSDEQRWLTTDKTALLHRGAVAVVKDVDVGQIFQRRLVDTGVVVLSPVEAERDVIEGLASLVSRLRLLDAFFALLVDALYVFPVDQQQDPVLRVCLAGQVGSVELRHALPQVHVH